MTEVYFEVGSAIGGLIVVFFTLNVFFIKRLVSKIEIVVEKQPIQQIEMKNMGEKMDVLEREIRQMGKDFREIMQIRERVTVLEFAANIRSKGKIHGAISE